MTTKEDIKIALKSRNDALKELASEILSKYPFPTPFELRGVSLDSTLGLTKNGYVYAIKLPRWANPISLDPKTLYELWVGHPYTVQQILSDVDTIVETHKKIQEHSLLIWKEVEDIKTVTKFLSLSLRES